MQTTIRIDYCLLLWRMQWLDSELSLASTCISNLHLLTFIFFEALNSLKIACISKFKSIALLKSNGSKILKYKFDESAGSFLCTGFCCYILLQFSWSHYFTLIQNDALQIIQETPAFNWECGHLSWTSDQRNFKLSNSRANKTIWRIAKKKKK